MDTEHTQGSLTKEAIRLAWPAVVISLLTVGFADQIIEFCGSNEDTHAMAARYYRIIMGGMIFNVLSMGINAAQRGAGNTMIALRTNLISNLVNICGILHFGFTLGLGMTGIWMGILADQVSRFLFASIRFRQGKWVTIKI